jgi:diacylglycerol kinase family enzyme
MSGIGVVVNPKSRYNLRDRHAASRLARRLGDHGVVREAWSIDELYRIAGDFRHEGIDVLAISGGDGTNTVTLTGFIDVYGKDPAPLPQVALLRGGTMNTVANSIGVPHERPDGLLQRLVDAYVRRAVEPIHHAHRYTMRVEPVADANGAGKPQFGFLFGTGVVHGFLSEYYGSGDPSPLVALNILARASASAFVGGEMIRRMAAPFRGRVTLEDGTRWDDRDYLAVAAGTIAEIGLNFKPFHRFAEGNHDGNGAFHVLGIHASPTTFVLELPRVRRGVPMRSGRAYEAVSTSMLVESTRGPVRYMIDGDLHTSETPIEVKVGPRVRLIVA